jgi:hypothetical protein
MAAGEPVRGPAQEAVDRLLDQGFLDELMAKVDGGGVQLTGEGGFCRSCSSGYSRQVCRLS